jgi:hypothetical protein
MTRHRIFLSTRGSGEPFCRIYNERDTDRLVCSETRLFHVTRLPRDRKATQSISRRFKGELLLFVASIMDPRNLRAILEPSKRGPVVSSIVHSTWDGFGLIYLRRLQPPLQNPSHLAPREVDLGSYRPTDYVWSRGVHSMAQLYRA